MNNWNAIALASCVLGSFPSVVAASCTGMATHMNVVNGKQVWKLYAEFDSPNDVVLVMLGIQGVPTSGFFQSDLAGGTWAPQATIGADIAIDSFVLIGGLPGPTNWTTADPLWGLAGFLQPSIPDNAAWYNPNPPTLQGKVDPITLQTWVAQFSIPVESGMSFTCPITVAYNQGLGTPTQFFDTSFTIGASIPAPAALCVLFAPCLFAGSRRRQRTHS